MFTHQIQTANTKQMERLEKRHLDTWERLSRFEPKKYIDATHPIFGYIRKMTQKTAANGSRYTEYKFEEENTNRFIRIMDFTYMTKNITDKKQRPVRYMVVGELSYHPTFGYSMFSPSIFTSDIKEHQRLLAVYPKMRGISEEYFKNLIIDSICQPEHDLLPKEIRQRNGLPDLTQMARMLHFPESADDIRTAKRRLLFDDLLYLAIGVQLKALPRKDRMPLRMYTRKQMDALEQSLPFTLTEGQKETVEKITELLMDGKRINALIQGDVACGKSITAFLLMVLAAENGYQSVIMAPTVVLAKQHFEGLSKYLKNTDIKVGFLSSGMTKKEKEKLKKDMKEGTVQCIVATHSVTGEDVAFSNLGLVIVDEEQRFGVETREALNAKSQNDIAYLSMSATPIPRTMAECIYGDHMQVFTIKGMPAGRKSVKTYLSNDQDVPQVVADQIKEGRQVYVICPAIEENENDKRKCRNIRETEAMYKKFFVDFPDICIASLNGKQSAKTMTKRLEDFQNGKIDILISTTVVEVGVNNPNATVIVIQNAELFGLSTLHQLRGRVKRGSYQPYCILETEKEDNERLLAMLETEDGFRLAEMDLDNRKSGNILGLQQSGENRLIEEAQMHMDAFRQVKKIAAEMIEKDIYHEFYQFMNEIV